MKKTFWSQEIWPDDTIAEIATNLGYDSLFGYADGFLEIAQIAITEVCAKRRPPDLITPAILYNIRHSVELFLKSILFEFGITATGHKIIEIFDEHKVEIERHLSHECLANPFDYREWTKEFEAIIRFIAAADKDGQTLRYPTNRAGIPNLGGKANVSTSDVFCLIEYIKSYYDEYRNRMA